MVEAEVAMVVVDLAIRLTTRQCSWVSNNSSSNNSPQSGHHHIVVEGMVATAQAIITAVAPLALSRYTRVHPVAVEAEAEGVIIIIIIIITIAGVVVEVGCRLIWRLLLAHRMHRLGCTTATAAAAAAFITSTTPTLTGPPRQLPSPAEAVWVGMAWDLLRHHRPSFLPMDSYLSSSSRQEQEVPQLR